MILGYLIDRCVEKLKSDCGWNSKQVGSTPEGRPVPLCHQFFVSIFGNDTSLIHSNMPEDCHVMNIEFTARVSLRTQMIPADRLDLLYYENTISLMRIATQTMRTLMDNRETLRGEVNSCLASDSNEYNAWIGMTRSFKWLSTDAVPQTRDPDWFYSREPAENDSFNVAGYSIDLIFGQAQGTFRTQE